MERQKKIVVVDASVVAKWFVDEEHTKRALQLRDDYTKGIVDLRSTQLMPFEVLNALRYNPSLGQTEVEKAGLALTRFRMGLYPLLEELKDACVRLAFKHGVTIYDASYLALSQYLEKELYTADEKLLIKTKGEETIHHIEEYHR